MARKQRFCAAHELAEMQRAALAWRKTHTSAAATRSGAFDFERAKERYLTAGQQYAAAVERCRR